MVFCRFLRSLTFIVRSLGRFLGRDLFLWFGGVRVAAFFEKLGHFVTFVAKTNLLLKLSTYFLYHHSFRSNATKSHQSGNVLVKSAFKCDNRPGTFKCKRQHRKPQKSGTKIYLSTGYTLSTRDQKTPLIPLIYSQIHVTIFSSMAKPSTLSYKPTTPHNSSIRSD